MPMQANANCNANVITILVTFNSVDRKIPSKYKILIISKSKLSVVLSFWRPHQITDCPTPVLPRDGETLF